METHPSSTYRLATWSKVLYVFLVLLCAFFLYGLLFGDTNINHLILELLGIRIPLVIACLNIFFIGVNFVVMVGGIITLFVKTELTVSEDSIRYIYGKTDRELKWDVLEQVKLIAQDNGAMKNRTFEFYEKSEPTKAAMSINISFLEKRDEIISKVRDIVAARKITYNF